MNLKVNRSELLSRLKMASAIADRKSTMPLLGTVLIDVSDGGMYLMATDLTVQMAADVSGAGAGGWSVAVEAKALHSVVASLPADEVSLSPEDNGWLQVASGKVHTKLAGLPTRDFPALVEVPSELYAINAQALADLLSRTLYAVCNDETRFHLNGVLLECDDGTATAVSTDGHRLALARGTLPMGTCSVIVPRKAAAEIRRHLDGKEHAEVAVKGDHMFARCDGVTIAGKLIQGQFPPYGQVIPKESEKRIEVDRQALLDAIKRAGLMSTDTRGIRVSISKGKIEIAGDNPDLGEVREHMEADYDGKPMQIGFSPRYFADALSAIETDRVHLDLNGELDPGVVRPVDGADQLCVLMPMRL